jgi:glutamate carboxypeptidase
VKSDKRFGYFNAIVFLVLAVMPAQVLSQPVEQVLSLAKKEKPVLLETLKDLVSIESGSRDNEGLDKLANLIASRLKSLGGQVALVEPSDIYKMEDTPEKIGKMVRATFAGAGTKKILLIAHMDTVYPRGMLAQQPSESKAIVPTAWESQMTSRGSPLSSTR